jgi:hypothetical protein
MKTKAAALENYDLVKFVCNAADAEIISKIVGDEYIFRRGLTVGEFIESLVEKAGEAQIYDYGMDSDDSEANAAL